MLVKESLPDDLPRIDKKTLTDPVKFWALYAVSFYEKYFGIVPNKRLLRKAYNKKIKEIHDPEAIEALNFFYRIRRDEIDGISLWESFLFESPDTIEARNLSKIIPGKNTLDLADLQIPFGYYNGKMKVGKINGVHPGIRDFYSDLPKSADTRMDFQYSGRIWIRDRVISFWEYPETPKVLYKILNDIENEFFKKFKKPFTINPNNWYIEIVDKRLEGDDFDVHFIEWKDAEDAILIPVKDYKGSNKWSEKTIGKEHMKSPMEKSDRKVPYGIGSNNPKSKSLAWKQALQTSENLYPTFKEFLEL